MKEQEGTQPQPNPSEVIPKCSGQGVNFDMKPLWQPFESHLTVKS